MYDFVRMQMLQAIADVKEQGFDFNMGQKSHFHVIKLPNSSFFLSEIVPF